MKWAYYNEFDHKAAAWLRELIRMGLIMDGEVDERSIVDVKPEDLRGYIRVGFFAGIGGWDKALQLAGWPDDKEVWHGSCPCQCYSVAGKGKGTGDHRDLWPVFASLIRERRPAIVFGEQVEAAIGFGWFDRLRTDLEAEGYAVGGHVLGAHSVGAPHRRQRLYWVAQSQNANGRSQLEAGGTRLGWSGLAGGGNACSMGVTIGAEIRRRSERGLREGGEQVGQPKDGAGIADEPCDGCEDAGAVENAERDGRNEWRPKQQGQQRESALGNASAITVSVDVANSQRGCLRTAGEQNAADAWSPGEIVRHAGEGFWSDYAIIPCRDGKARIVEPGVAPLVDGIPRGVVPSGDPGAPGYANATAEARVMRLKGYGNSICVPVAVEFILATKEILQ